MTADNNIIQPVVEFLNIASKLIPDFEGKPEGLRSFLDSLLLVNTIKGAHQSSVTRYPLLKPNLMEIPKIYWLMRQLLQKLQIN